MGLHFGVLGPLEAWYDDRPLAVPSGRRRAVLAALLMHVGRPVPADRLVAAAWGDDLPADPRSALHTVVSRLRSLLGPTPGFSSGSSSGSSSGYVAGTDLLRCEPAGYLLDVPAVTVDAHRFETLHARAAEVPPRRAGPLLDEALGLWRGPAYAEFADHDFATLEAHRLDQLRLEALEARAEVSLQLGGFEDAIRGLQSLLADHPYREHALELLLTALYRAGRATDALARYREFRTLLAEELGLDPSPALRDLEARILGHTLGDGLGDGLRRGLGRGPGRALGPDLAPRRSPPPAPEPPLWMDTSTAFVGRDAAVAELVQATAANRLVTVTGTGGVGKSRLVAESLRALSDRLRAPITIVELNPVRRGRVDAAVAEALGLGDISGSVRAAVVEYLRISAGVLVLDGCEHVLAEASSLVDVIVRRCARVHVLATSRHRLGAASERLLPLRPLPTAALDAEPDLVGRTAAGRLLADRVRRLRPSFAVTGSDAAAVADICRRLDGLPLALELAASRIAVLGLRPVRDRLAHSLALLDEAGPAAASEGLRAVMDWSYRLLTDDERRLFTALSVFSGDFDVEAAESVVSRVPAWPEQPTVAGLLAGLVEASLLSTYDDDGEVRFRLLSVVRELAAEQLTGSGRRAEVHHAHAGWVAHLTQQIAADCTGPRSVGALARLRRHRSDIGAAVAWALDAGRLPVAAAITGAVELCPHWAPDVELSRLIVAVAEGCERSPGPWSALGMAAGGCALVDRGELARSRELARQALAAATTPLEVFLARRALGVAGIYAGAHDESGRCWQQVTGLADLPVAYRAEAHVSLSLLARYRGDLRTAEREGALALTAADAAGAVAVQAFALYALGEAAVQEADHGLVTLAAAAEKADLAGAGHVSVVARLARFAALVRTGAHDEAVELVTPLLHDERRAGAWPQLWTTLRILAELLASRDLPHEAAFLLAAAESAASAPALAGDDVRRYRRLVADLRTQLGADVVSRIGGLSDGVPRVQVVDRALAMVDLAMSRPREPVR